jgi:hypothetical protein
MILATITPGVIDFCTIATLLVFSAIRRLNFGCLMPSAPVCPAGWGYSPFSSTNGKPPAAHHDALGIQTTFNIRAHVWAQTP